MTKGLLIWGGFYALSVLASNSSFLRSNYFDKVFKLLIRVCLDLFTPVILWRILLRLGVFSW